MRPLIDVAADRTLVPYRGPESESLHEEGFSFVMVFGALRRHKAIIFASVVLGNLLMIGVLHLIPARYTAVASLVVQPAETRAIVGKPAAGDLPPWMPNDNSIMVTQVSLLRTRALASQVVDQLKLADDPEFRSFIANLKTWLAAEAQHSFPLMWRSLIPWNTDANLQAQYEDAAIQHLLSALSVQQQQDVSHVITVGFTSVDPEKASRIANAVVSTYLQNQIDTKSRSLDGAYKWAAAQLQEQRGALLSAEITVVNYEAAHGLLATNGLAQPSQAPSDRSGLPAQQLTKLKDELLGARMQLAAQQATLSGVDTRHLGYGSLSGVLNSPAIHELQKQAVGLLIEETQLAGSYAPASALAKVRAQKAVISAELEQETSKIVQNIRNDVGVASDRVWRLEAILSEGVEQYIETERASVELREMNRTAAAKRNLYEATLARLNEINEQRSLIQPDADVVSPAAVPAQSSFPDKSLFGGMGFLGSLILGFVLAALAEHRDNALRTGRQVEQALGVTNLGLVPSLKDRKRPQEPFYTVVQQPQSLYTEAVRSILTQLLHDRAHTETQIVLVTSALPGEGKTEMAVSLAAVAAQLGLRAAVIDLDLRHPSVARRAGLIVQAGLAEFMSGEVEFEQVVQVDPTNERLNFIPLSRPEHSSADVLFRWNIEKLTKAVRSRYDCVFLDMPPSLAISDIQAVSGVADATLFIVQWGKTSCSAARHGIAALDRIGLSVLGVALTQVDMERHALYGHEQFGEYHKRYLEYFRR